MCVNAHNGSGEINPDALRIERLPAINPDPVQRLHKLVFGDEQLTRNPDVSQVMLLAAWYQDLLIGFKLGYPYSDQVYYSTKGAVHPNFRRMGIATRLLYRMILEAARSGYQQLAYDTFPHLYEPMYRLGLKEQFRITGVTWNNEFRGYQVRMQRSIAQLKTNVQE